MNVKTACGNCGFVSNNNVPYRSKVVDYSDEAPEAEASAIILEDGTRKPLICFNCGWAMLIVMYWSAEAATNLDPLTTIRTVR